MLRVVSLRGREGKSCRSSEAREVGSGGSRSSSPGWVFVRGSLVLLLGRIGSTGGITSDSVGARHFCRVRVGDDELVLDLFFVDGGWVADA